MIYDLHRLPGFPELPKVPGGKGPASLVPGRAVPVLLEDHLAQHGPPPYDAAEAVAALVPAPAEAVESVVATCDTRREPVRPLSWEEAVPADDLAALWLAPHLVLDGLQLTATAIGALDAYIDLGPVASPRLRAALRQAIAERDRAALDLVPTQVADAPVETAAVALTAEMLAQVALFARYGRA